jgi:hypothetical protein
VLNPAEKPWARSAEWCAESGKRKIRKMLKTMLLAIATLIILGVLTSNDFSLAQTGSETDPRFEKLAKDLYPKAKQEGALVVYTIWDVEHIRFILAATNGFRESTPPIGRERDPRLSPVH